METTYKEVDIFKTHKITEQNLWHLNEMTKVLLKDVPAYKHCTFDEEGNVHCHTSISCFNRKRKTSSVNTLINKVLIDAIADYKSTKLENKSNIRMHVYNRLCEEVLPELTKGDINKAIALLYKTYIDPNCPKLFIILNGQGYLIEGKTLASVNCESTIEDLAVKIAENAKLNIIKDEKFDLQDQGQPLISHFYK
jgi:hypothetical protein